MTDDNVTHTIRLNVYGRNMLLKRSAGGWLAYYAGDDGKTRPAGDVMIPAFVTDEDVERYVADLCHEWATLRYPDVEKT